MTNAEPLIHFVGSGPGDPELLTLKAQRLLRSANVCVHAGSLVDARLLSELASDCEIYDSASMTLAETTEVLRGAHSRNLKTVRLHSGEPSIYGAIAEQMRALDKFAIPYAQVPGISSFQAAAAALCVELTIPELSQTVVLTRSPGRTPMPGEAEWWQGFHRHATYCLFLSVNKLNDLAPKLAERMGADCPCAVVYHASRPDQIVLRGTLETIAEKVSKTTIHSTAQVLIGYALGANEYAVSRLYADSFNHGFREAKTDAC